MYTWVFERGGHMSRLHDLVAEYTGILCTSSSDTGVKEKSSFWGVGSGDLE